MHRDDFHEPQENRSGKPQAGSFHTAALGTVENVGAAKPKPADTRQAEPEPVLLRTSDDVLVQVREIEGDNGPARWRVRVGFDGTVAGEPVQSGDVLLIGQAILWQLMDKPFTLL